VATGLTFDTGALIAAERSDRSGRLVWWFYEEAIERGGIITVPAPALAQAWRGNSTPISRMLKGCDIEPLDERIAKRAGELLAKSRTADVIDAVVVVGAAIRGDAIVTSDRQDVERLITALRVDLRVLTI